MAHGNSIEHGNSTTACVTHLAQNDTTGTAGAPAISLSRISSRKPARLAKQYRIQRGQLVTDNAGNLTEATVERLHIGSLTDLAETLESLESHQALCYGTPERDGRLVASYKADSTPGALTRTREDFSWPDGAGVLMLDIDYADTLEPMDAVRRIRALHPALADVEMLWRASASSGIQTTDGKIDTGLRGQRLYLIVDRADRIPEVGRAITDLLWSSQDPACRFDVASNGRLLPRQLVDSLVWQPERFDFAAPPILADKRLRRVRFEPFFTGTQNSVLDTGALVLTAEQQSDAAAHKAALKAERGGSEECQTKRAAFVADRVAKMTAKGGDTEKARRAVERAVTSNVLSPEIILTHVSGRSVTVAEIIADPSRWHNERFADPLEPDYHRDRRIAVVLADGGHVVIYSHAHGGIRYRVDAPPAPPPPREFGISRIADALQDDLDTKCKTTDDACKLVARHAWRAPWQVSAADLLERAVSAAPGIDREAVAETLARVLSTQTAASMAAIKVTGATAVSDLLTLADGIAHGEGIYVIKAPHGTGKTYRVLKPIADANRDARILAITNRVSLTGANASVLGLDDYRFLTEITDANGISTCINSLCNPMVEARATGADVVMIDEAAACLRELHSRGSTMGSTAPTIRARLGEQIEHARLTVLCDADWSDADTATLRALTTRPITVLEQPPGELDLRAVFTDEAHALADLIEAIDSGKRAMVACGSSQRVEWLTRYLRKRYPAKKIRGLHARHGMATSGNVENVDLLRDIDAEIKDERQGIDVLIYSPVVESGVSLNIAHFQRHFAFYGGEIAPSAMNQMLRRDRKATRWTIGICGSGTRGEKARTARDFEDEHAAAAKLSGSDAVRDDFEVCSNRYASITERASARWAQSLWITLTARGWILERGGEAKPETDEERKAQRERRDEARELLKNARHSGKARARTAFLELVLSTADLTSAEYERLATAYTITTRQSAAMARFEIMQTFGTVTRREVELFQRGKITSQLRLYRLATQGADAEIETGVSRALRAFDVATAAAMRVLFDALGVDLETGTGTQTLTHDSCLSVYHLLRGTDEARVLSRAGIARFTTEPKAAVTWVSRILRKFGLALLKVGQTRDDGRLYVIREDEQRNKDGDVIAPGLAVMRELARHTSSYSALESEVLPLEDDLLWRTRTDTEALIEALIERCIERRKSEWRAAA